jgi:hypothetical protein
VCPLASPVAPQKGSCIVTGKRVAILTIVAVVLAGGGYAGYQWFGRSAGLSCLACGRLVPTARVTRGSMTLTVILRGELRATKQTNLTAAPDGRRASDPVDG